MSEIERLDGTLFGPDQPCFGCGPVHPHGFHLAFRRDGDEVITTITPTANHQGPPGMMHGGLVTTVADEVAAWAVVVLAGRFGFTANLSLKLGKPVRVGIPVEARARIIEDRRRIVDVGVRMTQESVEVASGEFRFVVMDKSGVERVLGRELPEVWKRFTR